MSSRKVVNKIDFSLHISCVDSIENVTHAEYYIYGEKTSLVLPFQLKLYSQTMCYAIGTWFMVTDIIQTTHNMRKAHYPKINVFLSVAISECY